MPLSALALHPDNPRASDSGADVESLAASIEAHGLLQPLGVDGGHGPRGYAVRYGGRRLAALRLLAERGSIDWDTMIAVRPVARGSGREAALAENVQRVALHPIDEFRAYAELHAGGRGLGVADIALRFGVSERYVEQRLRLARVAPSVLDAFRKGKITLEHVHAFAATDDQEAQAHVLSTTQDWQLSVHAIRRRLTEGEVPLWDKRARLVGLDAYEAAGGRTRRDLFSDAYGGAFLLDRPLLERLATEKLEAEADRLRAEGWSWAIVSPTCLPLEAYHLARVKPHRAEQVLTPEGQARLRALEDRRAEIEDQLTAIEESDGASVDDDTLEAYQREMDEVSAGIAALTGPISTFTPEDKARSGCYVGISPDGAIDVTWGVIDPARSGAAPDAASRVEFAGPADSDRDPGTPNFTSADHSIADTAAGPTLLGKERKEPAGKALPAAVERDLLAQRTAGLQATVARDGKLALCLVIMALAPVAFPPIELNIRRPDLTKDSPDIEDSPARRRLANDTSGVLARIPADLGSDHAALYRYLLSLDLSELVVILAPLLAPGVEADSLPWSDERSGSRGEAFLAMTTGLDMHEWWEPTAESYFSRIPKSLIVEAVRETWGDDAARRLEREHPKKQAMAKAAAQLVADSSWLPPLLRVPESAEDKADIEAARKAIAEIEANPASLKTGPALDSMLAAMDAQDEANASSPGQDSPSSADGVDYLSPEFDRWFSRGKRGEPHPGPTENTPTAHEAWIMGDAERDAPEPGESAPAAAAD